MQVVANARLLSQVLRLLGVLLDTGKVPLSYVTGLRMRDVLEGLCSDSRVLVRELAADISDTKLPGV